MTPAETQRSPVKDIENAEQTKEREIYNEPNYKGDALDRLGGFFLRLSGARGKSEKEDINYLPAELIAQDFNSEVRSLGLKATDAEYIDKRNKARQKILAHPYNYTPAIADAVLDANDIKELMKPVSTSLGTTRAGQVEEVRAYARPLGAQLAPEATADMQTAIGLKAMQAQQQVEGVVNILPYLSPEEARQLTGDNSVRSAFLSNIRAGYTNFLNTHGGVNEPQVLNMYMKQATADLQSQGVYDAAGMVAEALEPMRQAASFYAADQEKARKAAADVLGMWHDSAKMQLYSQPISIGGQSSTVGNVAIAAEMNLGDTFMNTMLTKDTSLADNIARAMSGAPLVQLKDSTKQELITINGVTQGRNAFAVNGPGYKAFNTIVDSVAQEVYAGVKDMSPEQLRQNSRYQAASEVYFNTHLNLDPASTTPEEQKQEYQRALSAIAASYSALTNGNGAVLLDEYGNPHYYRVGLNGKPYDASTAGETIELLDADAVNARDYAFADARRIVALAGTRIGNQEEAIRMWNEAMQQTMPAMNKSLEKVAGAGLRSLPSLLQGVSGEAAAAVGTKVVELLANSVFNEQNKSVVLPSNQVVSPINGKIVSKTENEATGLQRVSVVDDATGDTYTFVGKGIWEGLGKVGSAIKAGVDIFRAAGKNIGLLVTDPLGAAKDIRDTLTGEVPLNFADDLKAGITAEDIDTSQKIF